MAIEFGRIFQLFFHIQSPYLSHGLRSRFDPEKYWTSLHTHMGTGQMMKRIMIEWLINWMDLHLLTSSRPCPQAPSCACRTPTAAGCCCSCVLLLLLPLYCGRLSRLLLRGKSSQNVLLLLLIEIKWVSPNWTSHSSHCHRLYLIHFRTLVNSVLLHK